MDLSALSRNLQALHRHITFPVRVDQAVALQLAQPEPPVNPYLFQVFQAGIPAVKKHVLRLKTSLLSRGQHVSKVVVLTVPTQRFIVNPKIAGNQRLSISPQQGKQVDAHHHPMMFATPMTGHQFHLPGIRFVQSGVVQHQNPSLRLYQSPGFLPQRLGVGRLSPQQAGEGVMGWSTFPSWLTPGRFAAGEILLGGYQKVNIVQSITPGWVHSCPPPVFFYPLGSIPNMVTQGTQ